MVSRAFYLWILLGFMGTSAVLAQPGRYSFFSSSTDQLDLQRQPHRIEAILTEFENGPDTLFQAVDEDLTPLYYYRHIRDLSCFGEQCRPLNINLYWSITGSYLGFDLPEAEYLSKTDHEPFSVLEYERMNQILSDSTSVLSDLAEADLVDDTDRPIPQVDAITGATKTNLLKQIVPGAAYTTYELWHIIYGKTREDIVQQTLQRLSPAILTRLLRSTETFNKIWVLNLIASTQECLDDVSELILENISPENYLLSERAIRAINPCMLASAEFQAALMDKIDQLDVVQQKMALSKFKDLSYLSGETQARLNRYLEKENPMIVHTVLEVYSGRDVSPPAIRSITTLLEESNRFVSLKAYDTLLSMKITDERTVEQLKHYQKQISISNTSAI